MTDSFENLSNSLKEMLENIESDQLEPYLSVYVDSGLVPFLVEMVANSQYCKDSNHQKVSHYAEFEEDILEYILTILIYSVDICVKVP